MDKSNSTAYVDYLETRLKQLSDKTKLNNTDLDTLLDVQNEIAVNNSQNFKQVFLENIRLKEQLEQLQKKTTIYDNYIQYLTNSFWWKATSPFRMIQRRIKNRAHYTQFDFSKKSPVKGKTHIFIYANALSDALDSQLNCLSKQTNIESPIITVLNLDNSKPISKIAKKHHANCLNLLNQNIPSTPSGLVDGHSNYIIHIGQNLIIKDPEWLYKMLRPIAENYTDLSILYDSKRSAINDLKTNTPYNELRSRIFPIEHYECLLLPNNRDRIQYIPFSILSEASALAKRNYPTEE